MDFLDLTNTDADEIIGMFQDADAFAEEKRIVVAVWSQEKRGKTHFAYSSGMLQARNPSLSPELKQMLKDGTIVEGAPVWIIDTEGKSYKLRKKFKNFQVKILRVWVPDANAVQPTNPEAGIVMDPEKSITNFLKALVAMSKVGTGTLVIDSWTDPNKWARKLIQRKLVEKQAEGWELGDLIRLRPSDYEVRGDIMSFVLYYVQNFLPNMHVILTSRGEFKWDTVKGGDGKPKLVKTGILENKRYKETPFFADCEVFITREIDKQGKRHRIGILESTEYEGDESIAVRWENPTFVDLIEHVKDFGFRKAKMSQTTKKPSKPAKKKPAKKKATKKVS